VSANASAPQQSAASTNNASAQPVVNGTHHPAHLGGHLDIGLTPDQQQVAFTFILLVF